MSALEQSTVRNRLLSKLPADDFALLAEHLEPVRCGRGEVIVSPDRPFMHAYFPESGIGSILATSPEGHQVEAGLFGREGFAPISGVLGTDRTPNTIVFQTSGYSLRVALATLLQVLDASPALRSLLLLYTQVLNIQISCTALSNAVHQIDERLARWLLMCHDRSESDDLALTHEFMSVMLAVRRPSVTTSLHVLEGNGYLRSERGSIQIRNRLGLEQFAADAYGQPEAEYRRLIGDL